MTDIPVKKLSRREKQRLAKKERQKPPPEKTVERKEDEPLEVVTLHPDADEMMSRMRSSNKKPSKYAAAEERLAKRDVFDTDFYEEVRGTKVQLPVKTFTEDVVRGYKTDRTKKMLDKGRYEIVITGTGRSDNDIVGIMNKKAAKRKERKAALKAEWRARDKERDQERRKAIGFPDEEKKEPVKYERRRHQPPTKTVRTKEFSKEDKENFRKAIDLNRRMKKKRKKMRQAERKLNSNTVEVEAKIHPGKLFQACATTITSMSLELGMELGMLRGNEQLVLCITYFFQMLRSKSAVDDLLATTALCAGMSGRSKRNYMGEIVPFLVGYMSTISSFTRYRAKVDMHQKLEEMERNWASNVEVESGFANIADSIETMMSNADLLVNSAFISAIKNVILVVLAYKLLPKETAVSLMGLVGKPSLMYSVPIAVSMVAVSIISLLRMLDCYQQTGNLNKAFMAADPLAESIKKGNTLMSRENLLYYGLPTPGGMCAKAFMMDSLPVRDVLETYSKRLSSMTTKGMKVLDLLMKIDMARNVVRNKILGTNRIAPMAIVIHGVPQCGKSFFLNWIAQLFSDVKGRVFEPSHIFHRTMNSDYWDTYDSISTPFIHYSECGSLNSNIAKMKGDDIISELTSVCDSVAMPANMSDVKDKGRVFVTPELVLIDTNEVDMNLPHLVNNPSAYFRRFIYIEPVVKSQYRLGGTMAIDPSISPNDIDKWTFNVHTRIPTSNVRYKQVEKMCSKKSSDDIAQLEIIMRAAIIDHVNNGMIHMQRINRNYFPPSSPGVVSPPPPTPPTSDDDGSSESEPDEDKYPIDDEFLSSSVFTSYRERYPDGEVVSESFEMPTRCKLFCNQMKYHIGNVWKSVGLVLLALLNNVLGYCYDLPGEWVALIGLILWYWLGSCSVMLFLIFLIYAMCARHLAQFRKLTNKLDTLHTRWRRFKYAISSGCACLFNIDLPLAVGAGAAGAITILLIVVKLMKKANRLSSEAGSVESVEDIEDQYNCGDSYARFKTKSNPAWTNVRVTPSVHTSGLESLSERIHRNVRRCLVVRDGKQFETQILGVCKNFALINRHSLGKSVDPCTVRVSTNTLITEDTIYKDTIVYVDDLVSVADDIVMIALDGIRFVDITSHFPNEVAELRHIKGMIAGEQTRIRSHPGDLNVKDLDGTNLRHKHAIEYSWRNHSKGRCGLPVLGQRDSGACIVGIHCAGDTVSDVAYGVVVTRNEVNGAIDRLTDVVRAPSLSVVESRVRYGGIPHPKSPVWYERISADYYGNLLVPNMNQKSCLIDTPFSGTIESKIYEMFGHIREERVVRPLMKPVMRGDTFVSPYNNFLRKVGKQKKTLDPRIMARVVGDVSQHIIGNLEKHNCDLVLQPITLEVALNGSDIDAFMRRTDTSKAAGFGTPGIKADYCDRVMVDGKPVDVLKDSVKKEMVDMMEAYMNGESAMPVFTGSLKDEPRLASKVAKGNTRVFYATPFAFLLLQKMFLSPIYTLMVEHGECFGTAIGIDMHREADKIYNRLKKKSEKIVEGDFGEYDTSMPDKVGNAAKKVILAVLKRFGYNDMQLMIVSALLDDALHPLVIIIGELFCIAGLQPSGMYGTAENNSIRNLIIQVYIWYVLQQGNANFFDNVEPCTYGDDLLMAVAETVISWYNAQTFAVTCQDHFGLRFTTAGKDEISTPYIGLDDMSFLKRKFVYNARLHRICAPLELDSIIKMLEWRNKPKGCTDEDQIEGICNSACREMYFHCDASQYVDFTRYLRLEIADVFEGRILTIPTYAEITKDLCPTREPVGEEELGALDGVTIIAESRDLDNFVGNINCSGLELLGRCSYIRKWPQDYKLERQEYLDSLNSELKEVDYNLENMQHPASGMTYRQAKQLREYNMNKLYKRQVDTYFRNVHKKKAILASIDCVWSAMQRDSRSVEVESGMISTMSSGKVDESTVDTRENLEDMGGDAPSVTSAGSAFELQTGQRNVLEINDFMARPVLISTITCAVNSTVEYKEDIWSAFLSQPSIRSKLRNYAYLRGDLNVRIIVAGTPFHSGKIQVSYQPLAYRNDNLIFVDYVLASSLTNNLALTYLSQARGGAVLDVRDNKPLDLHFPYISPQPMMRLYNTSTVALSAGSDYDDSTGLGSLYLTSINPTKSTSTGASAVSLYIYAWMTNVQVGAPTATVITVTTESRELDKDERIKGPVEKIATGVRNISDYLSMVPVISPFAKASSMVAGAFADVSAIFGFSYPNLIDEPARMRPDGFQNGAQTIGLDTGKRITLDPKQELTVDPRVVGIDEDDMSISYLCSVDTYLTKFTWSHTSSPMTSILWTQPVSPKIMRYYHDTVHNLDLFAPTALAFAAAPFKFWRGDINYRFEIVCSNFHRGKLAIFYEPNPNQFTLINSGLDLNKQFIQILDIQETQDHTYCVEWAFPRAWAEVPSPGTSKTWNSTPYPTSTARAMNGYIGVVPISYLISPDNSDIEINVYVSSDNMMFNQLSDSGLPDLRPSAESREIDPKATSSHDVSCTRLNPSSATMEHITELHFGEAPTSFRSLLKRFTANRDPIGLEVGDPGDKILRFHSMGGPTDEPYYGGSQIAYRTLFSHLRYAYVGMRGGLRHRLSIAGGTTFNQLASAKVHLRDNGITVVSSLATVSDYYGLSSKINGSVQYALSTNAGVEFEIPYYNEDLFSIAFGTYAAIWPTWESNYFPWQYDAYIPVNDFDEATNSTYVYDDIAAGEDFSFLRFNGAPLFAITP